MSKINKEINTILNDVHIIQNSKYAALYFKSKNIFLPIELDKLDILNNEQETKEKQNLLHEINKMINDEADIEKLESNTVEKIKKIDTLEIIIQTDCNLNCKYCYAEGGHYGYGKKHLTSENAIYYLDSLLELGVNEIRRVRFFGGEPSIFPDTIATICDYFKKEKEMGNIKYIPQYGMVTNGTYYSDKLSKLIIDNNIMITFSIDGPKEINDQQRVFKSGKGSYDIVIDNINKFRKDGLKKYAVEMTYTNVHIDSNMSIQETIGYIQKEIGTNNVLGVNCRGNTKYAIAEDIGNKIEIENIQTTLRNMSSKKGYTLVNMSLQKYLNKLLSKKVYSKKCSAGFESLSIFPDGKLYPCHAYVQENQNFQIGSLVEKKYDFERIANLLSKDVINEKCTDCWCQNICVGCPQTDMHKSNCKHIKEVYETIILLLTEISEDSTKWDTFVNNYNNIIQNSF